jgi:alginate O-acetyltransferase complex protein AlgI
MLFNSLDFIALFAITALLYFNLPQRYRAFLLLVSSYVFYASWRWDFALVMLGVTLVNYVAGFKIGQHKAVASKRAWLWGAITISLLPLLYLKYANFFIANINTVFEAVDSQVSWSYLEVILPVGISFFTFQALSYALDVYHGRTPVERNLINFSVFVAFFSAVSGWPY